MSNTSMSNTTGLNDKLNDELNDTGNPTIGLLEILDDLAALLENARTVPLSSNIKVDRDQALGLVDELRAALPTQVARADEMLAEARRTLDDARHQGEEIIATARARAIELVDAEQVVVQARSRAAEIVDDAERRAQGLQNDADAYCDGRLAEFEEDLKKLTGQVRAGRARLAQRLENDTPRVRWDAVQEPEWPQEHSA